MMILPVIALMHDGICRDIFIFYFRLITLDSQGRVYGAIVWQMIQAIQVLRFHLLELEKVCYSKDSHCSDYTDGHVKHVACADNNMPVVVTSTLLYRKKVIILYGDFG